MKWLLIFGLLLAGCAPSTDSEALQAAAEAQVLDYKGEKLDSILKFRENSIKGPQYINIDTYSLKISGLISEEVNLTYEEVLTTRSSERLVTLHCVEGWDVKLLWEGIHLTDLLEAYGADKEASTIIFYAYDGYSTAMPYDFIKENDILLAYKMNGVDLPAERGFPFQLVAQTKYGYKWIKWVTEIEVSNNVDYLGFWEQRGYTNNAQVPASRLDGNGY